MSRKIALVSIVASSLLCSTSAVLADSLQQIYDLAKANDATYRAAQAALLSGQQSVNVGRGGLLPNVNVSINGEYSEPIGDSPAAAFGGAGAAGNDDNFNSSYSASLSQTIFDMADWYSYRTGSIQTAQAEHRWDLAQQSLITRTVSSYLNVLRAIDNLETTLAQKAAIESQLEQTQQRFEVGLVAITDVLDAQASYDNILATEFQARGNLGIAFEELTILTGQQHRSIAPLMESYPISATTPVDAASWVELAQAQSPDLQIAELAKDAAEITAKSSWTPYLPTLNGRVTYGGDLGDDDNGVGDSGAVVVALNVPIVAFTGGSTIARRKQAYYGLDQAEANLTNTTRRVEQSVRSQHLTVTSTINLVRARLQAIRSAESALEATQAGYEVGTRNQVEVLNAQQNLYQARRNYLNSRYDYINAVLTLKATAGTLTEDDIVELNRWLDNASEVTRTQFQ